jgi:hypothetical protein
MVAQKYGGMLGLLLVGLLSAPLGAQWLNTPTPGIPRTADGKPDLSAPAPKSADGHPDLSGVWAPNTRTLQDLAVDLKPGDVPYQPWAAQLVKERANGAKGKDDPAAHCVPGMPKLIVLPYPYKIAQLPGVTIILYEGFTTFRQVFTDGRPLPKDPQPSWLGHLDGQRRPAAQRRAAYHRAVHAAHVRGDGRDPDDRRPESLHAPVDRQRKPVASGRRPGSPRVRLHGEQPGRRASLRGRTKVAIVTRFGEALTPRPSRIIVGFREE